MAGGEHAAQAFREALCREMQDALPGQDVIPMKYNGQLYKDGRNFAQVCGPCFETTSDATSDGCLDYKIVVQALPTLLTLKRHSLVAVLWRASAD